MIITRLYSKTAEKEKTKKTSIKSKPKVKNAGIIEKAKKASIKIVKNPKVKKGVVIGSAGLALTGATGIGVKRLKNKKKENEVKEQILKGIKK